MRPDLGIPEDAVKKLRLYHALLLKWQSSINLISPNTVAEAWERHFLDCAQLVALIPTSARTLYDIGAGAGFPGLVLTILRPDINVTLIESDSKKCAFLRTVSRETDTKVEIWNDRIEQVALSAPAPDLICARALAPLEKLFLLCQPWIEARPDVTLLFMKGAQSEAEIERARAAAWQFDITSTPSATESGAAVLAIHGILAPRV